MTRHLAVEERGASLLVVLVLLTVMLLGGLALARMTETSTLVAGNVAFQERAMQASEVGVNDAFAAIRALVDDNLDDGAWYHARMRAVDGNGLPLEIDWARAPQRDVDLFRVSYVVDRLCSVELVTDAEQQCLLRQAPVLSSSKGGTGGGSITPPSGKQFRITVRVTGPKDTRTFVQAMVTRS